jgi:hypothetical protein
MRKTGLVAAGLALTLTLVGCGSKEAGTPSAADGSSGSSSDGGGVLKVFGNALDLAGAVNNNNKAKSAKITMQGTTAGQTLTGDGAFSVDGSNAAVKMTMNIGAMGQIEMVIVDKAFYMKMPASLAGQGGLSADKPWIKISANGTDALSKSLGPMLEKMGDNFDISKQMAQLKDAGEITKSAKETLDGAETTHYWIKIDMLKAIAATQTDPQLKQAAEDAAKKAGSTTADMQMWVSADNLPLQIKMTMPAAAGQNVDMTVKYSDWGKPVDIKAPPADQVGELPR